jgi:hypothetical protein
MNCPKNIWREAALLASFLVATDAFGLPDQDGDGIADVYELFGYLGFYGEIDFPSRGANPLRKDIFVEADVMTGVTVPANGFQDVVEAFVAAPVLNPDGTTGISLHVDASGSVPFATQTAFRDGLSIADTFLNPRIAVSTSGLVAVTWQDDRDGNGYYEIYARGFDAVGAPGTGEILVNGVSDGQQKHPDVAVNGSGTFVVVWEDDQDGNGYYEILGKAFSAGGSAMSGNVAVNSSSDGDQLTPVVAMDGSGNWIAVWQDDRDANGYYELFARRFDSSGNALTGESRVNQISDGQQRDPDIAMGSDGRAVVVWEDDQDGNGYYEILARRLNANGTNNGDAFTVNQIGDGDQLEPAVAMNATGAFVVCWEDDQDGNGYYEILVRTFNGDGTANGGQFTANQVSDGQQRDPAVGLNSAGRFTVTWEDDQDGNGYYEILARTFNANTTPRTSNRTVNADSDDQQVNPGIGMADGGNYAVVWQDDRDDNDDWTIFIRIMTQNGIPVTGDIEAHDNPVTFGRLKSDHFTDVRSGFFHYCVVANSDIEGAGGWGELGGDDFIINQGMSPPRMVFSASFMHELGHNLTLYHGGNESRNFKPNYMSVMNYSYALSGVDNSCDAQPDGVLDYSMGRKFNLMENALDERIGICNGEKSVNWLDDGQERDPDIGVSDSGSFFVAWEDDRDGNGYQEIFARSFDATGAPLVNELSVNPVSSGQQRDPAGGMASNGRAVVVWEDDQDGNGYYEIHGRRFNAAGAAVGGEIIVNQESDGNQRNPDVAVAADGSFVVVWEDDRDDNGYYEIFARRFNANGVALTGDIAVNAVSDGQQYAPRAAVASDGRFVVVWEDDQDSNGYYEVLARRVSAAGTVSGGNIVVNSVSDGQQRRPDVGMASDGRFVVVWEDDQDDNGYYEIFTRRFNANGTAMAGQTTINQDSDGQQRYPRVHANASFEFAVVWQDDRDSNGYYEAFARAFRSNGAPRANEITVNAVSGGQQLIPVVGMDSSARFYVAWEDDRNENGYYEIFALRANAAGLPQDRVAIDWDGDGNATESGVSADINGADESLNTLKDYDDWSNLELDF